jgi:alkanesulfonate monooxygenase SsuD/methylene tetrahydromethanopterin reductase-like flavin-dependent oxidoreductase (luciferase family)
LPEDRLTIGIGSGGLKRGAVGAVADAASELIAASRARIVIGALGPRMGEAAGRVADGALLNWSTPMYAKHSGEIVQSAAAKAGKPSAWVGVYVRVGLAGAGASRVMDEARRYAAFPQYAAHFARMGVEPAATTATGTPAHIRDVLAAFDEAGEEVIVRAIAADESVDAYVDVLRTAAPRSNEAG